MEAVPDVAHRLVTHYGETIKKTIQFNGTLLQRVGVEREIGSELCVPRHIKSCLYKWDLTRIH